MNNVAIFYLKVVGEIKDGDVVHTSYFQGGRPRANPDSGLDSLLDFPLFYSIRGAFAEGQPINQIPRTLAKDYLYANPNILVTLLGGHDDGRFMSEPDATIEGLKLANAFVLTTRGVPQLYYGDEIAMTGSDEPTTRADFPGGFPGDKKNAFTAGGRSEDQRDLFDYIRKLLRLRVELEPLRGGNLVNLYVSGQQYAYARTTERDAVVLVFNNDIRTSQIEFEVDQLRFPNGATLSDRLDVSSDLKVTDGKLSVTLPARSVAILTRP